MFRWLVFVSMSLLTVLTGGVVTWQLNDDEITPKENKMISEVQKEMEKTPMKYVIIKYGVEWKNDNMAVVSGRTIFNMPIVTAQVDERSVK
jgi:hypothetical protein